MKRLYDTSEASYQSMLRDEGIDGCLVMDWWLNDGMANRRRAGGIQHEDVQRIVAGELRSIRESLNSIATEQTKIRTQIEDSHHGWKQAARNVVAIGSPIAIIGVFVALVGLSGTTIYQLMSRTREETAFRANTDSRLRAIEDKMGIPHPSPLQSAIIPPKTPEVHGVPSLEDLAIMDQSAFSRSLVDIPGAVSRAQGTGKTGDIETVLAIQKKLAAFPLNRPEVLHAAYSIINYASAVRIQTRAFSGYEEKIKIPCQILNIKGSPKTTITNSSFNGCSQRLDLATGESTWENDSFSNMVIRYAGGKILLKNVTFKNCVFIFEIPPQVPLSAASQFTMAILANDPGGKFTVTTA